MKSITVRIKDRDWVFTQMTSASYQRKHQDPTSAGTADLDAQTVDLDKSQLCIQNIIHELMHIYYYMSLTMSADLNVTQVEEMCCDIVGEHAIDMVGHAFRIMNGFLLREERE